MKKLGLFVIVGLMAMMGAAARAETFIQLPLPASLNGVGQSGTKACAGTGFNADGTVVGVCKTQYAGACSGRGCQPVVSITTYVANWDVNGDNGTAVVCSVTRHHLPQVDTTQYVPGYDATTCPRINLDPTKTVVTINGVPFYYVTTDAVSGAELVNSNFWGFLYLP